MNVPPKKQVKCVIDAKEEEDRVVLKDNLSYITNLAKAESVDIVSGVKKPDSSATYVFRDIQVHVSLKGLINYDDERKRIAKEIKKIEREMSLSQKKLANKDFLDNAPDHIVESVKTKVEEMSTKLEKLNHNIKIIEELK